MQNLLEEYDHAHDPSFLWLYLIAITFLLSFTLGCNTTIGPDGKPINYPEGALVCGFGAGPPGAGALTFIVIPKDAQGTIKFGPDCHPQVDLKIGG
jgi:hypothetical protein